jgi:glycosyltransferase involved in cell wall biosynthesis
MRRRELLEPEAPIKGGVTCVGNYNPRSGIGQAASDNARLIETMFPVDRVLKGPGKYHLHYYHGMPQEEPEQWVREYPTAAYWMVETTAIHPDFRHSADCYAEIWTGSNASKLSIETLGTNTPVVVVPHVVPVPHRRSRDRGKRFRIFTAMAPPTSRKNPEGVLKAFRKAFPISKYRDSVELVFKFRTPEHTFRHLCKALADNDPRVTFLFEEMGRDELNGWYANSDAYISLQRGGAFELHCAEAAASGLPIITTKVGGVTDYLDESFARLINGVEVSFDGEHKVNSGGTWIEPDINQAASALREYFDMPQSERSLIRDASRQSISEKLSEERVKSIFKERITRLIEL